jgi:hypothetical protein
MLLLFVPILTDGRFAYALQGSAQFKMDADAGDQRTS